MATEPTEISAALLSLPERKETLRKAFGDLEEHRALIASCSNGWTDLEVSLSSIHDALEKRYAEMSEKETKLEERMKEQQDALDKRESLIESREQASLARVQEQKDAAVAAIREEKRQWIEEKQLLQSQLAPKSEPDSKPKQQDHKAQKEQVKKNSSGVSGKNKGHSKIDNVAGSVEACGGKMEAKVGKDVAADSLQRTASQEREKKAQGKQGSAALNAEDPEAMESGDEDSIKPVDEDASDDEEKEDSHKKTQFVVTARPELISLCEKMDGPGLYTYLVAQKRSTMKVLQRELPIAMQRASDPPQLVLQAIIENHFSDPGSDDSQVKKPARRRSCIALLESLSSISNAEGKIGNNMSDEVKHKAQSIAELWKSKLNSSTIERVTQLDRQAFFFLLAAFRLTSNFDEDELCDLVIPICFRRKTSQVWRALGLAHKAPGVVDSLIEKGRHIDAISFVLEFQLAEKHPPVEVLRAYLREMRKGHTSSTTANEKAELHRKELSAAKRVLRCVRKYDLQEDYPLEGLQRRILQLEKLSFGERKRVADTILDGLRKARAINGPGGPFRPPVRFNGRGTLGRGYGFPFTHGSMGGYPYPAGGRGYPSSFAHGNYQYGGRPPYQGPYLR